MVPKLFWPSGSPCTAAFLSHSCASIKLQGYKKPTPLHFMFYFGFLDPLDLGDVSEEALCSGWELGIKLI